MPIQILLASYFSSFDEQTLDGGSGRSGIRAICMSGVLVLEHHAARRGAASQAIRDEPKEIEGSERTREARRIPLRGYLAVCLPACLLSCSPARLLTSSVSLSGL